MIKLLKILRYLYEIPKFLKRPFFVAFNRIKLNINGVKVGDNCRIYNKFYLHVGPESNVVIGNDFIFSSGANFNQLARNIRGSIYVGGGAKLYIGNSVGISSSCVWTIDQIRIGNNVKIGADCLILDHDAHSLNYIERRGDDERNHAPISIGDDVFIGTRSIILKGVNIGDRTIIGAGSVVSKSIPNDCIAAGNPCRVIRTLNK